MDDTNKAIAEFNKFTDRFTQYVHILMVRSNAKMLEVFSEMRNIPIEEVIASDIFYIGDSTEMLLPDFLDELEDFGVISPTNKKPIFHDRWVIPIKDTDNRILNLVGYSKEANERYVYGTAIYYRRREVMYGLENLGMAYKLGYALYTEGITDTIRVRSMGYKNCFANCGTHASSQILNRCKYGVIEIPDRDAPGRKAVKRWIYNRTIILSIFIKYKDIDELCRESNDNIQWAKEYIDICIDWIKSGTHNGFNSQHQEITMQ